MKNTAINIPNRATWILLSAALICIGFSGCGKSPGSGSKSNQTVDASRRMWVPKNTVAFVRSNIDKIRAKELVADIIEQAKKRPSIGSAASLPDPDAIPETEPFDIYLMNENGEISFLAVLATPKKVKELFSSAKSSFPVLEQIAIQEEGNGRYKFPAAGLVFVEGSQAKKIGDNVILITNNESCLSSLGKELPAGLADEVQKNNLKGDFIAVANLAKLPTLDGGPVPSELEGTEFPNLATLSLYLTSQDSVLSLRFSSNDASKKALDVIPNRPSIESEFGLSFNVEENYLKLTAVFNDRLIEKLLDNALGKVEKTRVTATDIQSKNSLRQIHLALMVHKESTGKWPKRLDDLVPHGFLKKGDLLNKKVKAASGKTAESFVYLKPRDQAEIYNISDHILVYEPVDLNDGLHSNVVLATGEVRKLTRQELETQLEKQKNKSTLQKGTSQESKRSVNPLSLNGNLLPSDSPPSVDDLEKRIDKFFKETEKKGRANVQKKALYNFLNKTAHDQIQRALRLGKPIPNGIKIDSNNDGKVSVFETTSPAQAKLWYINRRSKAEAATDATCNALRAILDSPSKINSIFASSKYKLDSNGDGKIEELGFYAAKEWYEKYRGNLWGGKREVPPLVLPVELKNEGSKSGKKKRATLFPPSATQPSIIDKK